MTVQLSLGGSIRLGSQRVRRCHECKGKLPGLNWSSDRLRKASGERIRFCSIDCAREYASRGKALDFTFEGQP